MSEFHDDVTQLKIETLTQRLRDAEETIHGNGRPGLKERMTTMENTVQTLVNVATDQRTEWRRLRNQIIGALAVMALAYVGATFWNNATQSQDTEKIVRETVRAMTVKE